MHSRTMARMYLRDAIVLRDAGGLEQHGRHGVGAVQAQHLQNAVTAIADVSRTSRFECRRQLFERRALAVRHARD